MLFRTISVRLLESRPPLTGENTRKLPPPAPKKWISYFGESPQSRATRLSTHPDHMVHVDHIKTTLRIKGRPAATIFSHLLQTGLWDDNALTHIIQFQADRIGQYPTFESAIPAYIAYRDNLTPVTKAWVSLVVGALPLAPIQPQFETDLYEWIRLATGAHGVSQTNLPLFLERYEIELKESLHAAGTMGRFGTDDSPLLNRLIPLIIRAFSEARPDWKSLQTAPSIDTAVQDRDAHLQHQKTRLLADWEILIAQLIKYTAWSDAEAREFVLRYPTDFNPKGGVKFNLGSNKLTHTDFDKFLINHVEKGIIDSLMPNAYIKPIIEAWREVRNKNCQPLQRAQLIDASIYEHLKARARMYQAAGLPSNEWAYAEKWINTQHFFTLPPWNSRAWIMRDPQFVPTQALVKKGIDEAILNRIPVLRDLLPSWREKEPNRSIQVLADRFTSLRDVGLIINPGVFAARDHPRFAPSFPQLFPQTIETPPPLKPVPFRPVAHEIPWNFTFPFGDRLMSGTLLNIPPAPASIPKILDKTVPIVPPPYVTQKKSGHYLPLPTNIPEWFKLINPILDSGKSVDDVRRVLFVFPEFTPHADDCTQLNALHQKIEAQSGDSWPPERVAAVGPVFHDLIQEAAIAESTVLTYIIELGPKTHAFEHQIATVVKGVPIGPARMITFIAHYRRLTDPTSPAIETIKHRATEYFRLHFSIQEIVKCEKQLPSDLSKADTQELIRRMFFNRFPPLLIDGMEACYHSLIGARAISEIANPEYLAAEVTLRHARDARYSEKQLPETWAAAIDATIRQNYPAPYAIADDVLDHYIETLTQLVDSDRTTLRGILDRLDIPHDTIEEILDRVRTIAATPIEMAPPSVHGNSPLLSVNQSLGRIFSSETTIKNLASSPVTASPEDYLRSISNRVPTAFTQALSGCIQRYSDHHQSIFSDLGIHPEDFSLVQETLQIGTPDSEIRRDIDRSLISGLAKKRWEWYASLQINPAVWDINIRTFPQQPGESKTNHTRRFLGVVRSKLDATTRLAIYQQKGFHQGQVEAIERIGNQHFADLMQSDPKTAVSRAIDIFSAPDRMATYQKLGYRGGTVQWVERIYAELPDTYPTHKEKFEAALADRSRKDAEHIRILEADAAHQSRISKAETVHQIRIYEGEVAAYRYLGIEERDIPIIRARWPGLSDEARIEKYIEYQDRCYQYRLNSIPESEHLKFDTTHWKEGMTGKATIEVYKTELKLQKIREAEKAEAARKQEAFARQWEADRPAREAREWEMDRPNREAREARERRLVEQSAFDRWAQDHPPSK